MNTSEQMKEQLTKAIGAHSLWKTRLAEAVSSGKSEWSPETVQLDNRCEFGKFLHDGISIDRKTSAYYQKIKDLHAQFHVQAAQVLQLGLSGQKETATQALALGSEYHRISMSLVSAIMDWQHHI